MPRERFRQHVSWGAPRSVQNPRRQKVLAESGKRRVKTEMTDRLRPKIAWRVAASVQGGRSQKALAESGKRRLRTEMKDRLTREIAWRVPAGVQSGGSKKALAESETVKGQLLRQKGGKKYHPTRRSYFKPYLPKPVQNKAKESLLRQKASAKDIERGLSSVPSVRIKALAESEKKKRGLRMKKGRPTKKRHPLDGKFATGWRPPTPAQIKAIESMLRKD